MNRLLAALERRFGKFAIPNLTVLIVGGMGVVFVLALMRPAFLSQLTLDLTRVRQGEVWRLVTYLFIPESRSPIWVLLYLYWFWLVGTNLENEWGALKFNVYYLLGMVGTTAAAAIAGGAVGNVWLNLSLFLAFATVFPDYEIFVFFILRVKVKWLGMLAAAGLVWSFVSGDWATRGAVTAASVNYLVFFTGHLIALVRNRNVEVRQAARRTSLRTAREEVEPATGGRVCAICRAAEDDGADIRVCSCEKCGGKPRTLCLAHAREH